MSRRKVTPSTTRPMSIRLKVVGRVQQPMNTGAPSMMGVPSTTEETCTCLLVESVDTDGNTIPVRITQFNGQNILAIPTGQLIEESELAKGTILELTPEA